MKFLVNLAICVLTFVGPATAQWSSSTTTNNMLCNASGSQEYPRVVSDGSGGAIVTWGDYRTANADVYAQRIDGNGTVQWSANGVAISAASYFQLNPDITTDGSGGAIIVWQDFRVGTRYDVYAQRVNGSGTVQWTPDGVEIGIDGTGQVIASDDSGGAIIAWAANSNIYAQRIDAGGMIKWTPGGVAISAATGSQNKPRIVGDGAGGAIIIWTDYRNTTSDIYAQRVNAAGIVQWTVNGVALCSDPTDQANPSVVSDGSGGAIVAWEDPRNNYMDIYIQRINSSGTVQWGGDGTGVVIQNNNQFGPVLLSDGSGGAFLAWSDRRDEIDMDVYIQRVDSSGSSLWTSGGVRLTSEASAEWAVSLVSDGAGGAIVTIEDYRSVTSDVYAQRVNSNGVAQWTPGGIVVSNASNDQYACSSISDGSGSAIITWMDKRSGGFDIYTSRVGSDGSLPVQLSAFTVTSEQSNAILRWRTEAEISNYGFEIERRRVATDPGRGDYDPWTTIGFVPGAGTTSSPKEYSYSDDNLPHGRYAFRVRQIDFTGTSSYFGALEIEIGLLPNEFLLMQNYPNPFNPETRISYSLPTAGFVNISLYDPLGRLVETLVDGQREAGHHSAVFNGKNHPTGMYVYRMVAGKEVQTRRMMLVK